MHVMFFPEGRKGLDKSSLTSTLTNPLPEFGHSLVSFGLILPLFGEDRGVHLKAHIHIPSFNMDFSNFTQCTYTERATDYLCVHFYGGWSILSCEGQCLAWGHLIPMLKSKSDLLLMNVNIVRFIS